MHFTIDISREAMIRIGLFGSGFIVGVVAMFTLAAFSMRNAFRLW